jgi:hypothetical protein
MIRSKKGWHFLPKSRKLTYRDGRRVRKGVKLEMKYTQTNSRPILCIAGMHAAETISEAAAYQRGPVLCYVDVTGPRNGTFQTNGSGKFVGAFRKVLWWREVTKADINRISKEIGHMNQSGTVTKRLREACRWSAPRFNEAMTAWANRHGAPAQKKRKR